MEFAEFYYTSGEDIARSRTTIPTGDYYLYSVSFPNLTKIISTAGIYSPTGEETNVITIERNNTTTVVNIPEGIHSSEELVNAFNLGYTRTDLHDGLLEFVSFGSSQYYIRNNDTVNWTINFRNQTTRRIFLGDEGALEITVNAGTVSNIFTPDPFLGNHSTVLQIQNGVKVMINNSNEWLSGGTLYFTDKIKIKFDNTNIVEMYADFPSLNIYKKLYSPINSVVKLGYKSE